MPKHTAHTFASAEAEQRYKEFCAKLDAEAELARKAAAAAEVKLWQQVTAHQEEKRRWRKMWCATCKATYGWRCDTAKVCPTCNTAW